MSAPLSRAAARVPIPPTPRSVLRVLADHADDDGGNAFPSVATIADLTGFSVRTVQYALDYLQAARLITAIDRRGGRKKPSRWLLDVERITNARSEPVPPIRQRVQQKGCNKPAKGATDDAAKGATGGAPIDTLQVSSKAEALERESAPAPDRQPTPEEERKAARRDRRQLHLIDDTPLAAAEAPKGKHAWPEDRAVPQDWRAAAAAKRDELGLPPANLDVEAEKFRLHWTDPDKRNRLKSDWRRAWLNWCMQPYVSPAPCKETPHVRNRNDRAQAVDTHLDAFAHALDRFQRAGAV